MSEKQVLNEVIIAYRALVEERYQYSTLQQKVEVPSTFSESFIDEIKGYYMEFIYPDITKRNELNDAFDCLDDYVNQPDKLLRILLDSAGLIFKYGRHLPKILNAGLKALKSFRTVNKLEKQLVEVAIKNKVEVPFDQNEIHGLIRELPRKTLDQFVASSRVLFETYHDQKLVDKILGVMKSLIEKMEAKPDVYSTVEVRGIQIGRDLIYAGNILYNQLETEEEQRQLIQLIVDIEEKALDEIYQG